MKKLWIWNHDATYMFRNRSGRHYWFAKYIQAYGFEPVVFCASTNHFDGTQMDFKGNYRMAAFGMPVITSDIPVCHEVFDGVENVYFISNEDGKRDMGDFVRLGSRCVKDRRLGREQTVMREVELLKKI